MHETSRSFLLSIALVPACSDGTPAKPLVPALENACSDYYERLLACYAEIYPEYAEMYADDAYADYFDQYCSMFGDYIETPECEHAFADYWACLSRLPCGDLLEFDDRSGCNDALQRSNEACPEYFGFCTIGTFESSCGMTSSGCLDGREYGVACDEDPAQMVLTCECSVDGMVTSTFMLEGTCFAEDFYMQSQEQCGFPEGVFHEGTDPGRAPDGIAARRTRMRDAARRRALKGR